jgi:hypothetical protein
VPRLGPETITLVTTPISTAPDERALTPREQKAVNVAECRLNRLESIDRTQRRLYYTFQPATITLAALTPVLILLSHLPKAVQALPAALAGVCAGLIASFHWRENYVRAASAKHELEDELFQFKIGTGPYADDEKAFEEFVKNLIRITKAEIAEFRELFTEDSSRR